MQSGPVLVVPATPGATRLARRTLASSIHCRGGGKCSIPRLSARCGFRDDDVYVAGIFVDQRLAQRRAICDGGLVGLSILDG